MVSIVQAVPFHSAVQTNASAVQKIRHLASTIVLEVGQPG